jgi:hypothetical protein
VVALLVAALVGYLSYAGLTRKPASRSRTLHYTANIAPDTAAAVAMGFDLFDVAGRLTDPERVNLAVDSLPVGTRALVWVGNLDNAPRGSTCPPPAFSWRRFTAQVEALKHNPRVYGYYLSDEPHPSVCAGAAADIKARADYIHANAPGQRAFIVVQDGSAACGRDVGCEYRALQPARTDVDLVGLDPYPCHYDGNGNPVPCDDTLIIDRVDAAVTNGIPEKAIVPVFQAFGEHGRSDGRTAYYRMPSAGELTTILRTWSKLVPGPAFDYFYTFGVQCRAASCPAPQAIINTPGIRPVVETHNAH